MTQKYFALWGASGEATESYNDVRRMKGLGENFIELKIQTLSHYVVLMAIATQQQMPK